MPGTVLGRRHTDGTVTVAAALGGEVEHIAHKHLRDALLILVDVLGTIQPGDGGSHRRFQLTDGKGKTVDQQHQVQPFTALLFRVHPLIGDHILVLVQFAVDLSAEQVNGDLPPIFAKGIGVLLKDQFLKGFVLGDQILGVGG